MSDAPERITVHVDVGDIDGWRVSTDAPIDDPDYPGIDVEYVRADLYAELEQERDIFQDTVKKLAALEQERNALDEDEQAWRRRCLEAEAEVERLRAAIREAREFLHQPGPVGINTFHLMLDGILKGALTKTEGEE